MNSEIAGMNMDKAAFFKYEISEILDPEKMNDQPSGLRERVESFVRDCAGTADGEMDISFQENGRGYYAHQHELERLRNLNQEAYRDYLEKLLAEIEEARNGEEFTSQMKVVYESLDNLER
ncbi:MAG: hypothetical protein ABFS45_24725 [Pseudomonadota bacterium]